MLKKIENFKIVFFAIIVTLFIGIAYTSSDFISTPTNNFKDIATLFFQWIIIVISFFPIFYFLSINKYIFAVTFPIISTLSSILMYFRYATGTIFTTMIFDAALDNDKSITLELISFWLILTVILSLAISILFVVIRFKKIGKIKFTYIHFLCSIILFCVILFIPRISRPMRERIPVNLYYIPKRYFSEKEAINEKRPPLAKKVVCPEERPIIIFILGESLRADHLSLNGYKRNTNEKLSKEDIISLKNIFSEYTHTNPSVAHIMTRADSANPELADRERSFIDIFKNCGYYSAWLANQEPAKQYIYFMNECDTIIYGNINKSYYVFDKWTDDLLLPPLDSIIKRQDDALLLILHSIGSHWYYNSHFSDEYERFLPITKSRITNSNSKEEMINSYDNTVLFTDNFIATIINKIRDKNAVLIYLSDHSESFGENGIWLHANDNDAEKNPACLVWMSEKYKENNIEKYNNLIKNKDKKYRSDFLFHSIIDIANIKCDVLNQEMSIFNAK